MTYFTARSNLVTWEKVKTVDFSETIAACDLKAGRCRQLIEFMKVYEHLCMKIKTCFSQKPLPIIVCSNDDPGVTLTYFTARSNFGNLGFSMGKWKNSGYLRNYCSQWPENL